MYSHPDFNEEVGVPDSILQDLINADGAFDFEKYAGSGMIFLFHLPIYYKHFTRI